MDYVYGIGIGLVALIIVGLLYPYIWGRRSSDDE